MGIDDVVDFFLTDEAHFPDFAVVFAPGVLVFEDSFSHEDEGEYEAEVDFEGVGFRFEPFEEVSEDVVVHEEFFLLIGQGDAGFPEAVHRRGLGLPEFGAVIDAFEGVVFVDEGGVVFFAGVKGPSGPGTHPCGSLHLPLFHQ